MTWWVEAKGYSCVDGRKMRHDPQTDDPYLQTDVGRCPDCDGEGCMTPEYASEVRAAYPDITDAGLASFWRSRHLPVD